MSDVHLEMHPFEVTKADGVDALILAGDIGLPSEDHYAAFLKKARSLFDRVIVVAGNHEYYRSGIAETDETIRRICDGVGGGGIHFLQNQSVDLDGDVRVVGTTLWSEIKHHQRADIACFMADFRLISDWDISRNNWEHSKAVEFLQHEISRAERDGKRLVVVTHHAPYEIGTSRPEHDRSPLTSAFCTDLSRLFGGCVAAWAFGHTHHCSDQRVRGTRLVSNQRGYPREGTENAFDPTFAFDV